MMAFEKVLKALHKSRIRYLVIGGVAVNLQGYYRATGDLDIMLAFDEKNVKKFIQVIKKWGWQPRIPVKLESFTNQQIRKSWVQEKRMKVFSVYNPKDPIEHIDVMVKNYLNFEKAYQNRDQVSLGSVKISVASISDLIKLKKLAGRQRDKIDISALKEIRKLKNEKKKRL